jgi:SAM-dependent methyltransferase
MSPIHHIPEFDQKQRSESYLEVVELGCTVRAHELIETLTLINAQPGEKILEVGVCGGVLTKELLATVGNQGTIFALDDSIYALDSLNSLQESAPWNLIPILIEQGRFPLHDGQVNGLVSLASMHHASSKRLAFSEAARVLQCGGRLAIADVAAGTNVQAFFDDCVDQFCSTGHRHSFLSPAWADLLCEEYELNIEICEIRDVPWKFDSREQAAMFLHKLFDATCAPEHCLDLAEQYLGLTLSGQHLILNWQLMFLLATK